jgi:hypothetical protein
MPLLNFKAQFVEPIRSGRKRHTIRAKRKVPIRPGDTLYLYSGLRRPGAFRILEEPPLCTKIDDIEIDVDQSVQVNGVLLDSDEEELLARADGFRDFLQFCEFWDGRRPFSGNIIHWK